MEVLLIVHSSGMSFGEFRSPDGSLGKNCYYPQCRQELTQAPGLNQGRTFCARQS